MKKARHYIREWRKKRMLTQERLGERVNLDKSTISRIERGETHYTQETLEAFAEALGCEPVNLLNPPDAHVNEIASYVMRLENLDRDRREQALRVLRAIVSDSDADQVA